MSVHVKTPTKAQFEHTRPTFPCRDNRGPGGGSLPVAVDDFGAVCDTAVPTLTSSATLPPLKQDADLSLNISTENQDVGGGHLPTKRKFRERGGSFHSGTRKKQGRFHKTGEKTVLPSKFLLGGNINDPLNLNALYHNDFGKVLNERTPQSSPLPLPEYKQEVKVLIPPNINDPLNLNADEDVDPCLISPKCSGKKKKHKHNRKRRSTEATTQAEQGQNVDTEKETCREINFQNEPEDEQLHNTTDTEAAPIPEPDRLVSPVSDCATSKIPTQKRPSLETTKLDSKESTNSMQAPEKPKVEAKQHSIPHHHHHHGARNRKHSHTAVTREQPDKRGQHFSSKKFVYGNYDRYYGYRNPGDDVDSRLACMRNEWFNGKDVLDIGCNIGHITLTVARDYRPKKIMGMDIDGKLITIAKKNIRHYMSNMVTDTSKFPVSMTRDPIAAPPCTSSPSSQFDFPNNVLFMQGNFVLDSDEELELIQEEYDTILALSLSKWLHLNFGDDGLKRAFKRMHRQLRPGGKLVLEPQPYASYKKKKKLSETTFKNFQAMRFRPEQFTEYLLSKEVGFIACEHLDPPYNKSQGFQRPLQVYTKSESNSTPAEGVTPLMEINCTPCTTPLLSSSHHYLETSVGTPPMFDVGPSV